MPNPGPVDFGHKPSRLARASTGGDTPVDDGGLGASWKSKILATRARRTVSRLRKKLGAEERKK